MVRRRGLEREKKEDKCNVLAVFRLVFVRVPVAKRRFEVAQFSPTLKRGQEFAARSRVCACCLSECNTLVLLVGSRVNEISLIRFVD